MWICEVRDENKMCKWIEKRAPRWAVAAKISSKDSSRYEIMTPSWFINYYLKLRFSSFFGNFRLNVWNQFSKIKEKTIFFGIWRWEVSLIDLCRWMPWLYPSKFLFLKSLHWTWNGNLFWIAKAKLLLSGLNLTLCTALHTCDVSHHVTWIGTFSKWLSMKRPKFSFAQYII